MYLGGHHTEEMLELPSEKGLRFRKVKGSDVYEVVESRILQLYDREGRLMLEADPLK